MGTLFEKGLEMQPKLAVVGAAGRMGRRIVALAVESRQFEIVGATDAKGHPDIGKDVGLLAGAGTLSLIHISEPTRPY